MIFFTFCNCLICLYYFLLIEVVCCITCNKSNIIIFFSNITRIKRNELSTSLSSTHIFNTNLYTCLSQKSLSDNDLLKWTKHINLFKKRIIFIPIQEGIHWSLCVVINPGTIKNNANSNPEDEISYILLLDSLKLHGKLNVLKNIRRWLNNVYEDKYTKKKIKIQKI